VRDLKVLHLPIFYVISLRFGLCENVEINFFSIPPNPKKSYGESLLSLKLKIDRHIYENALRNAIISFDMWG
jgi:hypothetical protein